VEDITKKRFIWAGHAWRKEGSLLGIVLENASLGKRPLGRPRLRWEDMQGKRRREKSKAR